jgi:lipopolysaccharide export system permease protein
VPRFDRYLLSQLLVHFGFFALVLVGVYWVNRAVTLFDQLMSDGQSAMVFVEFSLLTLPNVIRLVLPIAAFVASVYVANKLTVESELVVMQATGFSAFRMARPVAYFGLGVAVMMAILVHVLVPMSRTTMIQERAALSENITVRFLTDGQFTHPSKGVTFYINQIDSTGQLRDLFLEDGRIPGESTTFTARKALFVRGDSGPKLIMFDGMAQTLDRKSQRISVTRFADFTYDLGALLTRSVGHRRSSAEMSTLELLWPTDQVLNEAQSTTSAMFYEANNRLAEPILSVAVVLIGFGTLLLGGFSRLGLWRQIAFAVGLLVIVQGISTVSTQFGTQLAQGWALAYVAPVTGLSISAALLWWAGRSRPVPKALAA